MNTSKSIVVLGLLSAAAIVLHVVESWLPVPLPVPGIKLGLANMITLFAVLVWGWRKALQILLIRVILGSLLAGSLAGPAFAMSFGGGLISLAMLQIASRYFSPPLSVVGVSVAGAAVHGTAQILIATAIVQNWNVLWYLPYIVLCAIPAGMLTGFAAAYFFSAWDKLQL